VEQRCRLDHSLGRGTFGGRGSGILEVTFLAVIALGVGIQTRSDIVEVVIQGPSGGGCKLTRSERAETESHQSLNGLGRWPQALRQDLLEESHGLLILVLVEAVFNELSKRGRKHHIGPTRVDCWAIELLGHR
jgi:hypothetical protein